MRSADSARERLQDAERRLLAHYGIAGRSHRVRLADPPLDVRVLESGAGAPVVLVHGTGMSAATWAPLLPHLSGRRALAVDLPGFGLSDPHDYTGRPLRRHAAVQLRSLLDALGLARAPLVGSSMGAMWAMSFAVEEPQRVTALAALGNPGSALAGTDAGPFLAAVAARGVGPLAARLRPPSVRAARLALVPLVGRATAASLPESFFEVLHHTQRMPGWPRAMHTHLASALYGRRPRRGSVLADAELPRLGMPLLFLWGERDPFGSPQIGRRAVARMPRARLETTPGYHGPFLEDPRRCGQLILELLGEAEGA